MNPCPPPLASRTQRFPALSSLLLAACAVLAACSGSSDSPAPPPPPPPAPLTVSGVAASGAAFVDAVVSITDSRGVVVGTSTALGASGAFSIPLAAGATAPFVITAQRSNVEGGTDSLVSALDSAASATVNVTSVTTLIAARLSPSGNPLALATEMQAQPGLITSTTVATRVAELGQILAPVLAATSTTGFDPIAGSFTADGTGYDRLLDSISVHIIPASATASNIEIGIRQALSDPSAQLPVIQFQSGDTLAAIQASNSAVINATIDPGTLVEPGTNALIQQFLARVTDCYALPLASRIAANGTTAADITATACRNLFSQNNPANYLSNGSVVSATQSFSSLFAAGATGVVFDQGTYEFTRTNGDIVIGYHTRSASGSETRDSLVVRKEGNELKLIGNGYAYSGGVNAYMQRRSFPTLNQSQYDFHSTGYVLSINNTTLNGTPVFDRVEVTSPSGATYVMRPLAATESLRLVKNGVTTGTSYVRMRSVFDDPATPNTPAAVDTGLVFASPELSEAEVAAIPAQAVWAFNYYLASAPSTLAATQYYRTRSRALTLGEFRTQPMATLTDAQLTGIRANLSTGGSLILSNSAPYSVSWNVPTGALAPTQVTVFGVKYTSQTASQSFTDSATVATTARTANLSCAPASVGDVHCGSTAGYFAASSFGTGLHLRSRDSAGREFVNFYAMYTLAPP
ncbi:hypothetical protein ACVNIS_03270 [Sphaerotilaceae bacterium SBD11-9]